MTCPYCGTSFTGRRCPNCGRPVTNAAGRAAAVFLALLVTLPAALVGACSAYTTVFGFFQPHGGEEGGFLVISAIVGLASIALAIGSFWIARNLWEP